MEKYTAVFCLITAGLLAAGCGRYYTCDVAGYVKDANNAAGINGARVRFYNTEPATVDDEDHIVETSTMISGGNSGYFSHKIIWNNWLGSFGDEGDTGEIWIGVVHEDYRSVIALRTGLLSGTLNVVADLIMERASFQTLALAGRVVDSAGSGVNGVRLVLDLASTEDTTTDYLTVSGDNGVAGSFTFSNIRWRDETPDSDEADTESAGIYVDDNAWNSVYTAENQLAITLQSDDEMQLPANIPVTRTPDTVFSASLQGRCIYRLGTAPEIQELPISGVDVTLVFTDDNGVHTHYTQTNLNGYYDYTIEWEEDPPADNGTGLVIPEGEDVLPVDIDFSANATTGNIYTFTPIADYIVKSWLGTNLLPVSVDTDPDN